MGNEWKHTWTNHGGSKPPTKTPRPQVTPGGRSTAPVVNYVMPEAYRIDIADWMSKEALKCEKDWQKFIAADIEFWSNCLKEQARKIDAMMMKQYAGSLNCGFT